MSRVSPAMRAGLLAAAIATGWTTARAEVPDPSGTRDAERRPMIAERAGTLPAITTSLEGEKRAAGAVPLPSADTLAPVAVEPTNDPRR